MISLTIGNSGHFQFRASDSYVANKAEMLPYNNKVQGNVASNISEQENAS